MILMPVARRIHAVFIGNNPLHYVATDHLLDSIGRGTKVKEGTYQRHSQRVVNEIEEYRLQMQYATNALMAESKQLLGEKVSPKNSVSTTNPLL